MSKGDGDVATAGKCESNSISNQKDLIKNFLKDKKDILIIVQKCWTRRVYERTGKITLQITELENEIATAKKKCDEATEKEMEVNEVTALQDFDKIQLSKIIEKVFIYGPGRMEINWKMDDIFYKEEKA